MITVRTQIKEIMKDSGLGIENMSGDFMERLDARVKQIIVDAGSFNAKRMRIHFMLINGSAISQCLNDSVSNT